MKEKTILLIEDETDVMLANQEYLGGKGMRVLTAESLAEATAVLRQNKPDIILLDVMLTDGNGFDYIQEIHRSFDVPVIFLTCLSDAHHEIKGLQSGGCDYITKPYQLDVLFARIEANLRQHEVKAGLIQGSIQLGNIELNLVNNRASVDGADAMLKPMEFQLLLYLVRNKDKIISGETLYQAVWKRTANGDTRTIRVHIHELRKKLAMPKDNWSETVPNLETVLGKGYCLRTKPALEDQWPFPS